MPPLNLNLLAREITAADFTSSSSSIRHSRKVIAWICALSLIVCICLATVSILLCCCSRKRRQEGRRVLDQRNEYKAWRRSAAIHQVAVAPSETARKATTTLKDSAPREILDQGRPAAQWESVSISNNKRAIGREGAKVGIARTTSVVGRPIIVEVGEVGRDVTLARPQQAAVRGEVSDSRYYSGLFTRNKISAESQSLRSSGIGRAF